MPDLVRMYQFGSMYLKLSVPRVLKVTRVIRVILGLRAIRVLRVLQVLRVTMDLQVLPAIPVPRAILVPTAPQDPNPPGTLQVPCCSVNLILPNFHNPNHSHQDPHIPQSPPVHREQHILNNLR